MNDPLPKPPRMPIDWRDVDDHAIVAILLLGAAFGFGVYRLLRADAARSAVIAAALVALAVGALVLRARIKDRFAARSDPPAPGLIVASVKGSWRLARERPFRIPWESFFQHVLVCGATGRGKTFGFLEPILRALCARRNTGVFYLNGKVEPGHRPGAGQMPAHFDHVFCPDWPQVSARWNPLAGTDPFEAARAFAAALYPDAADQDSNYYEQRAVFALTRVLPAMVLTGWGAATRPDPDAAQLLVRLVALGVASDTARRLVEHSTATVVRQLSWLPYRRHRDPDTLVTLVERNAEPPSEAPLALLGQGASVTPADLARVLFDQSQLAKVAEALERELESASNRRYRTVLEQLSREIESLLRASANEHASTLANLQNRLGPFLQPPFLDLCSESDFTIADVCDGARIAFLVSVGSYPVVAETLGRVALAQFKNAVLASENDVAKVAVLEEFHNFVDPSFGPFLNQARSHRGAAVMAMQSLADFPRPERESMLSTIGTFIVTPGSSPEDAAYWADIGGQEKVARTSYHYEPRQGLESVPRRSTRVDFADEYRFTATQIAEVEPGHALIRLTLGLRSWPLTEVRIRRG
ncbi:MAG: Type secretory system Conjugative transfer [Solirubrobacteraceae bacterium]|jgi:hypothetical protein|nr:Type secretory system Conjugative transfer [Solirubrobacteraceae bacterium]